MLITLWRDPALTLPFLLQKSSTFRRLLNPIEALPVLRAPAALKVQAFASAEGLRRSSLSRYILWSAMLNNSRISFASAG
jgi:hypothetical protein